MPSPVQLSAQLFGNSYILRTPRRRTGSHGVASPPGYSARSSWCSTAERRVRASPPPERVAHRAPAAAPRCARENGRADASARLTWPTVAHGRSAAHAPEKDAKGCGRTAVANRQGRTGTASRELSDSKAPPRDARTMPRRDTAAAPRFCAAPNSAASRSRSRSFPQPRPADEGGLLRRRHIVEPAAL